MELTDFIVTILAGILATYGLIITALWMPGLKLPRLDFSKVMAGYCYGESFDGKPPYFAGQAVIYMNGIFFAVLFATVIGHYLPGLPLLRGAIWGVILWAVSGLVFVPHFLKEGYFLAKVHKQAWLSSLLCHGAYGLILGWLSPIV